MNRFRVPTPAALACLAVLCASPTLAGPPGAMGGGLRQLVNAWETGDARLPAHMAYHVKDAAGRPLVKLRLEDGVRIEQLMPQLQALGFRLNAVSELDARLVEGHLPLAQARAVMALDGVRAMKAVQKPQRQAGAVQSQAVALHKADRAQARGYDGQGIRIGVLSDSYDACPPTDCSTNAAADIGSGDLPAAGVTVLEEITPDNGPGSDEGRAMLQLVHDIAPGAQLGFASAFNGEVSFANNILALRSKFKADVIVDDVIYFDEPMFSDGIVAQAVDIVSRAGAAYFASAGNNGLEGFQDVYRPIDFDAARVLLARSGGNLKLDQIPAAIRPRTLHLFRGGFEDLGSGGVPGVTQAFTSAATNVIAFQWDEPFFLGKVKTDFNVYVFDADGNWMDPASPAFPGFYTTDDNTDTDAPFEFIVLPPFPGQIAGGANVGDYQIVIGKVNDGPARNIKYVNVNGLGVSQRQGAPTIWGHAAARGGLGVAATYYAIPNFPEDFSSPGPVTILLDKDGNRLREPEVRAAPQITAADGVDTTFFGFDSDGNGAPNFFGTSAAAPNAAAVAALALQAAGGPGSLSPQRLYRMLQRTASPLPTPNVRGINAAAAGPLFFSAQGDWTRWKNYFRLALFGGRGIAVKSVSFDLGNTPLVFSANPNRFHVGDANGVARADIVQSVSADQKTMLLTFKPGSFTGGEGFNFGMSMFDPIQGTTQLAPDRMRGARITVTLENGSSFGGAVFAAPPQSPNRFTGFGLVNAESATAAAARRQADD